MFLLTKSGEDLYKIDHRPTQTELDALGCDGYVEYVDPELSHREMGQKILEHAFHGNEFAQIADLTVAVLGLARVLTEIVGATRVNNALGEVRKSIDTVSDAREALGLPRYDVSFLDK